MTAVAEDETLELAGRCRCCGAFGDGSLNVAQPPALLAVCDVLVVWALESVGKRIVRVERARFRQLGTRPWHLAHTLWPIKPATDSKLMDKGLEDSWDIVPRMLDAHGCCGVTSAQTVQMIDSYVRDLLITGTAHSVEQLRYRFEKFLGVPIPEVQPYGDTRVRSD